MEIKTRYNIGDMVWFDIEDGELSQAIVAVIDIMVDIADHLDDKYGEMFDSWIDRSIPGLIISLENTAGLAVLWCIEKGYMKVAKST